MDNLLTVAFEAHHTGKNHHRRYEVTVGRDLFKDWTVAIRYGPYRPGRPGAALRLAEAGRDAGGHPRSAAPAPRRIGCPYRLAAFSHAPSFDATDWLPNDVMARFFATT